MLRLLATLAAVLALAGCGSGDDEPQERRAPAETASHVRNAPRPLAALYAQGDELLEGGPKAFEKRLRALRGYPVVVNKWASWCGPCRAEFPFFARQAAKRGRKVAFLGVNSIDNDGDARKFLERFPVGYPSYKDPSLKVAAVFKGVQAFPTTAFYDSKGELAYVKQGGYPSEDELVEDLDRYAR